MLKKLLVVTALLAGLSASATSAHAADYVRGYYRGNGTYVAPHYRSPADGNFYNNWSTKPNVNPYTGRIGTRLTPPAGYGGYSQPRSNWSYQFSPRTGTTFRYNSSRPGYNWSYQYSPRSGTTFRFSNGW